MNIDTLINQALTGNNLLRKEAPGVTGSDQDKLLGLAVSILLAATSEEPATLEELGFKIAKAMKVAYAIGRESAAK